MNNVIIIRINKINKNLDNLDKFFISSIKDGLSTLLGETNFSLSFDKDFSSKVSLLIVSLIIVSLLRVFSTPG